MQAEFFNLGADLPYNHLKFRKIRNNPNMKRRTFLKQSTLSGASLMTSGAIFPSQLSNIEILNPLNKVPVSFIIDDSTALVNLAYYGIPQFQEVFPDNYKQDWRKLPREIPDSFVLEFLEWCDGHGVKGKYSMVPYPACTGWLNRFIPGWTKKELEDSIKIVREQAQPNWDIHSEMISHTRVINTKTGVPFPEASPDYMENWEWSQKKSADELGEYIAYSLQILKDTGLHCDGVTTPGGFGSENLVNLALGTREAVREVYGSSVAHFFRNLYTDLSHSVAPEVTHPKDLDGDDPQCSVHIIGCTGDWFGGWDGLKKGDVDMFITRDLENGRMVDVIESGEPAIMVCHWPGIYYNGEKVGFNIFKEVVSRIHQKYDHLKWMKLSEIAQYWAAKEYTKATSNMGSVALKAPFPTADFTLKIPQRIKNPALKVAGKSTLLKKVASDQRLEKNSWCQVSDGVVVCLDLPKGQSEIVEG